MPRKSNWPSLIPLFLEEKQATPFAWGTNDCAMFAADWICILTRIDPAKKLRGTYSDQEGAKRVLRKHGGMTKLAQMYCNRYHWPEIPIKRAQRGDLVLFKAPSGISLGVCFGAQFCGPCAYGLEWREMKEAIKTWRIC